MTVSSSPPRLRARRLARPLVLLPLVVALSACSGSSSSGGAGAASGPASGATSGTASSAASGDPGGGGETAFPLDAYLGAGGGTTVISSAAAQRKYQESIARCMAAQGFDYVPEPSGSITATTQGGAQIIKINTPPPFPNLPPDQFAARFGYGISTAPPAAKGGLPVDPNDKIVAAMSVAERVAYEHALYGPGTPLTSQGYLTSSISSSPQACTSRASRSQPTDDQVAATQHRVQRVRTVYQALLTRIDQLSDQEMADSRMVAATREWSGCMAAAGFPGYTGVDQPRARSLVRARALMGHDLDPSGVDPARLARLRRTEIDTAVSDNRCRQPWDQTFAAVRRSTEETFVRDNLRELRSYRSAMAAAQQSR
jgi:hypothetical protein